MTGQSFFMAIHGSFADKPPGGLAWIFHEFEVFI
jgi:hypothetical protein